jgi:hypothetical protein
MSHTPAPWNLTDALPNAPAVVAHVRTIAVIEEPPDKDHPAPDAHLIASAPDLLDALEGEHETPWHKAGAGDDPVCELIRYARG